MNKIKKPRVRLLDAGKICFIMAVNNQEKALGALECIKHLKCPPGKKIEFISLENKASMTDAYQHGMEQSNAKYKIYLHQDVTILRDDFLLRLIDEFSRYPQCGIMGVVGSRKLPASGIWWEDSHLLGAIYDNHEGYVKRYCYANEASYSSMEAAALDGLILCTQYDVDWRQDIFCGWDFYDISQCMEFKRCNLTVRVLSQNEPLILHMCGQNLLQNYDMWREKFLQEYAGEF